MRLRAALVTAAAAATAIAITAGTFGADSPPASTAHPSPALTAISYPPGAADSTTTISPAPAGVALTAHDTTPVGPTMRDEETVLDEDQRTLYRFDRDTADPSASSCVDACAMTWPPVLVAQGGSVRLEGIAPTALGTVTRPDTTVQLTLGGWPVYRYAKDRGPADLAGHGVGGTWFAVTPTGDKTAATDANRAAAAAAAATPDQTTKAADNPTGAGARACPTTDPARAAPDLADTADTADTVDRDTTRPLLGTDPGSDSTGNTDSTTAPSGSTSTSTSRSTKAALPSDVLDLADWYLTLPTGKQGNPDTVEQPDLGKLANEFFKVNDTGDGVVFSAPRDGVTTKNSHFPRSELREMNGTEKAAWSNTSGTHTLDVCEAITQVPSAKPEVVGAQIHDDKDDVLQIRLEGQKLTVQYDDGKSEQVLDPNYTLGTPYNVQIVAADSKVDVLYNGQKKAELPLKGSGWYFKAGAYVQSNTSKGDGANSGGAVTLYALKVSHQVGSDGGDSPAAPGSSTGSPGTATVGPTADAVSPRPTGSATTPARPSGR